MFTPHNPNPVKSAMSSLIVRLPERDKLTEKLYSNIETVTEPLEALWNYKFNPHEDLSNIAVSKRIMALREALRIIVKQGRINIDAWLEESKLAIRAPAVELGDFKPDEFAAETRGIFRGLEYGKKLQWLNTRIERKEGSALAAVLLAPETVTGLSQDVVHEYTSMYLDKFSRQGLIKHLTEGAGLANLILAQALTV